MWSNQQWESWENVAHYRNIAGGLNGWTTVKSTCYLNVPQVLVFNKIVTNICVNITICVSCKHGTFRAAKYGPLQLGIWPL